MNNGFAENLKWLRNTRCLTQEKMAKKLGITRSTYGNYELGRRTPDADMLVKIAKTFQISVDDLLDTRQVERAGDHKGELLRETSSYRVERHGYTVDEFLELENCSEYELIYGQLVHKNAPAYEHQQSVFQIGMQLYNHIAERDGTCKVVLAPFCVILDEVKSVLVQPDISVICSPELIQNGACYGAPDIIVEVVSPDNKRRDYYQKVALYEEYGVKEYWIVDSESERVTLYNMVAGDAPLLCSTKEIVYSTVLEGFGLNISAMLG